MAHARSEIDGAPRANGQARHPTLSKRLVAPHRITAYQDPFHVAASALLPWGSDAYPGFAKGLWIVLKGRASPHTIRDWRRGKRKAPAWARALVREALERRLAEIKHGIAILD